MKILLQSGIVAQLPELVLIFAALVVLAIDAVSRDKYKKAAVAAAYVGTWLAMLAAIFALVLSLYRANSLFPFSRMVVWDGVSASGKIIILLSLIVGQLLDARASARRLYNGEFHVLLLFASTGAMVLASASNLVVLILGLEILSIPMYTLAAFDYRRKAAREAGLKYLILGSFASGFAAVGCALYYAGCGTFNIGIVTISENGRSLYSTGAAMILTGLMFKGGILPFFAWSPDAYEGAPDFAVGLMAAIAKTATFLFMMRFVPEVLPGIVGSNLITGLTLATAGTMIAGNILALAQTNIKRMLAYSSVAHAGYMFLGILAFRPGASGGILFYLAGYAPILVGCFNIVALFPGEKGGHELRDYIGMGHRSPFIAGIFTLMLLTLAGLPPTPVFWGKLLMFMAAVDPGGSNLVNLVILAMLTSLIGVYYYLRVVVYMYMREPEGDSQPVQPGLDALGMTGQLGFWLLTFVILILGLSPGHLIYVLDRAVNHLRLPG